MSERQVDESTGMEYPLLERLQEWSEEITVLSLVVFMFWIRIRSLENFTRGGDVFYSGNDPYYHLREVSYTVRHWPATMPFDPWSYYPYGTSADQFGTLFDQVVATAALVVGLGSPSQQTIAMTLLVAPAVIGALVVVPAYYAGRRVGGVYGGLFGAVVLALLPGSFLARSLVGAADHHVAEIFAQMVTVLAFMVALGVAREEKPVYELIVDRDFDALRRPVGWAAIAGIATGLYVWTWPPAVLIVGIAGVFFAIKIASDYYHGHSPEPTAFVAVISMGVAGVMSLLPLSSLSFSPTSFGLIQPVIAFAVAVGAGFLAWLAREWDDRELDETLFPVTIGAIATVGAALTSVLLPGLWRTIVSNFQRILGFNAGANTRTIVEAQPFLNKVRPGVIDAQEAIMMEFGLMFFVALLTLVAMLGRPLFTSRDRADHVTLIGGLLLVATVWRFEVGQIVVDAASLGVPTVTVETAIVALVILVAMLRGDHDGEHLFVAVWALFITAAAFTQVRFTYYLALAVVVLSAHGIERFLSWIEIIRPDGSITDEIEPYQMLVLLVALLTIVPVLVAPVAYYERSVGQGQTQTYTTDRVFKVGNNSNPGAITEWQGTLEWMNGSTPKEGEYGGADNELDYYGTYEKTDDFPYEQGTYGVMSWWDYGHWITVEGHRIPDANPFQQGATRAANYLLSPNESHAKEVLERGSGENEETRYVVVDGKMADPYGKFSAPTIFYDDSNVSYVGDFVSPWLYREQGNGGYRQFFRLNKQRYYESTMIRLYRYHGSRVDQKPVVFNWQRVSAPNGQTIRTLDQSKINGSMPVAINTARGPQQLPGAYQFRSVEQARQVMKKNGDSTYSIGGFSNWAREPIPAMEHYRLVRASEETRTMGYEPVKGTRAPNDYRRTQTSKVKVFERVDGATVTGEGAPPNATVLASVTMQLGTRNENFTYTQRAKADENGQFEFTLPYSTTGYDKWGPDQGHTNVSVRAEGPYRISTNNIRSEKQGNQTVFYTFASNTSVSEGHVVGENTSDIHVELEKTVVGRFNQPGNGSSDGANNSTDGSAGNSTAGNSTAGNNTSAMRGPSTYGDGASQSTADADEYPATAGQQAMAAAGTTNEGASSNLAGGAAPGGEETGASGTGTPGPLPRLSLVLLVAGAVLLEVRDDGRH